MSLLTQVCVKLVPQMLTFLWAHFICVAILTSFPAMYNVVTVCNTFVSFSVLTGNLEQTYVSSLSYIVLEFNSLMFFFIHPPWQEKKYQLFFSSMKMMWPNNNLLATFNIHDASNYEYPS